MLIALAVAGLLYYFHFRLSALIILTACVGWAMSAIRHPDPPDMDVSGRHGRVHAVVTRTTDFASTRDIDMRIIGFTPDSGSVVPVSPFTCYASYHSLLPEVIIGDTVAFSGFLLPIPDYRDGRLHADSYRRPRKDGCTAEADIDWESLVITGKSSGSLTLALSRMRHHAAMWLAGSSLSENSAALMSALLLGDTSWLSRDTKDAFSHAGLAHLLAISGLHMAVIISMLSWGLYFIPFSGRRITPVIIILLICWAYTSFLGFPVPVTRAAVMISVLCLTRIAGREYIPLHSLFLAADIILLVSPDALFDTGFLLSFCSVAGIMLFAGKLVPFDPAVHPRLWKFSFTVTVPLAATLATLPVTATVFGSFPSYFILGNILLVWLMPVILGCGCIFLLLVAAGIPSGLLGHIINLSTDFAEKVAFWLSGLPGSTITLWQPGVLSVCLYLAFLALLYAALHYRRNIFRLAALCALILTITVSIPRPSSDSAVYAHRTRYGSTLIIETPPKAIVLLSDPLAADSSFARSLDSYWKSRGINSINFSTGSAVGKGLTLRVANSIVPDEKSKADIILIDRHFRGSISDIMRTFSPDTILLSTNIHTARARRYATECRRFGIPVIDLRYHSWSY